MQVSTISAGRCNLFTTTFSSEYLADVLKAVSLLEWNKDLGRSGEQNEIHSIETIIEHGIGTDSYVMIVTYYNSSGRVARELAEAAEAEQVAEVAEVAVAPAAGTVAAVTEAAAQIFRSVMSSAKSTAARLSLSQSEQIRALAKAAGLKPRYDREGFWCYFFPCQVGKYAFMLVTDKDDHMLYGTCYGGNLDLHPLAS